MNTTVLLLLAMYGLTFTLKDSTIAMRPREWVIKRSTFMAGLLGCSFCTGWHSGWIVYVAWRLVQYSANDVGFGWYNIPSAALYAFAGAAISYAADQIMLRIEMTGFDERAPIDFIVPPTEGKQIVDKLDAVLSKLDADT